MPAFVRLLYSTGLRFSEAAGLRWDDVDGRRLSVLGRGGKPRLVVMSASMAEVLERYRGLRVGGGGGLVFCGREGGPLQNQLVGTWHRTLLDSAGVRRADGAYPRPHDWRHTFAVGALARMDAAGVDARGPAGPVPVHVLKSDYPYFRGTCSRDSLVSTLPGIRKASSHITP